MKTLLCLFSLVVLPLISYCQDSLVFYKDITFNSAIEKQAFDDYFVNKKADYFMLFMGNGSLLNEKSANAARERFFNHIKELETKLEGKKNEKKIKLIYDDIHKNFLVKYELINHFEDIFYNGYYNCVSASALYGVAFHKLNIPFSVKEKPTHVYLLAYPENERVMVETTTPIGGSTAINPTFKQVFVKALKDQKLISAKEYASTDVNILFDKFYFGDLENITIDNLVGIQYMNDGVFYFEQEEYQKSFEQFEKAYLFYPSKRIAYNLLAAGYSGFSKANKRDTVHAKYLAKFSRYSKLGITSEMIQGEFGKVVQELLFEKGEKEKLDRYYQTLCSSIRDREMKNEINFIYNYENGRLLFNQARYKDAVPYFERAVKAKPNHQDANGIFINTIAQSFRNKSSFEAIRTLEDYQLNYPSLQKNNLFNKMLGTAYLESVEKSYLVSEVGEGEKYRTKFEEFFKAHNDIIIEEYFIGKAYSAAAVHYFKKGQNSKAKVIINKGLEISPNNYELMMRKRMIE